MTEQDKAKIGLGTGVAMIVGGMIGSAIFSLSGLTMFLAGPAAILSWLIGAAIMLVYGLVNAELATRFPRSGGVYVFPAKALGKVWGWLACWGYINGNICALAFAAIYVSTYLGASFPALAGLQIPLALAAIAFCLFLNIIKFSTAGKINNILVFALGGTLLVYIIFALFGGSWDATMLTPFFSQGASGKIGFLSTVPTAMVGYGSIVSIAFMVSEVKNPNRTVPKAVLIAMSIVVCIYALIILSTVGLVSAQFLAENPGMRFIPLFAACFTKLAAYPWLAKVVSIAAVLALVTTMLVGLALNSRAIRAAAEDGILPKFFGKSTKSGAPVVAATVTAVLGAVISCFPEQTTTIVNLGAFFSVLVIVFIVVALFVARRKFDLPEGAFRAPGGQALLIILLAVLLVCNSATILSGTWQIWCYTIAWYFVGWLIYRFSRAAKEAHMLKAEEAGK